VDVDVLEDVDEEVLLVVLDDVDEDVPLDVSSACVGLNQQTAYRSKKTMINTLISFIFFLAQGKNVPIFLTFLR
jgi:hypothetical protein